MVDDENDDLNFMRRALESEGHTVLQATDYKGALEVFQAHQSEIDLLLADVALPRENGCELAKVILDAQPRVNVLLVSGHAGASVCDFYGLKSSDLHFLRKPFSAKALVSRINQVLSSDQPFPGFLPHRTAKPKVGRAG